MADHPTRCRSCNLPLDERTLRAIIHKAIEHSLFLQARGCSFQFSTSDMAGDIVDAIMMDREKAGIPGAS